MGTFVMVLLAAVMIEAVITIIVNIRDKEKCWKYWASLVLGVLVSVLIAVNWDIDLFKMAGFSEGRFPFVGAVLTGVIISRGSNVVSDLIGVINMGKTT